ncbi:MAG: hypothetical protein OEM94_06680 [Acidimicrobiia bacterium]|nr:hypothetical protein [Acidimicrobiia bacterium]
MRRILLVLVVIALVMGVMAAPVGAGAVDKTEYSRTECVFATGPPGAVEMTGKDDMIWHIRDFPYVGFLTDDGEPAGINSGLAAIDLNTKSGSGSIRGTLTVRDEVMGDFDGFFSGHYKDGEWQGRGSAGGVDDDAGKLLKVRLEGLDVEATCGAGASDAARWEVEIIDPQG